MEDNPIRTLFERVKGLFADILEPKNERALSVHEIAMRAEEQLPDFAWIHDMFFNEAGAPFVIYSNEGRLFKAPVMIAGDNVVVGESQEVVQEFRPTTSTRVIRQSDGTYRWFSQSATAVLNRVGEIDSRELFDSFITHAQETGEYPYRTFFHQGEQFRTGQADYLARDGYVYITSGVYDDNDLARAEIEARERTPDYYGESIGFRATAQPDFIQVEGVDIPVYTRGVNVEISTLPEHKAASWYTNTVQEVNRMRDEVRDELLKLYNGDETRMNAFVESVDATNREIEDEELLTRAQEDVNGEDSESEQEQETETDDTDDESEDETETDDETEPVQDVEVDDALLGQIAEQVEQSLSGQLTDVTTALEEVARKIDELTQRVDSDIATLDQRMSQNTSKADERFRSLERTEDELVDEIAADMSARAKIRVSYRPSQPQSNSADDATPAQRAENFDWGR